MDARYPCGVGKPWIPLPYAKERDVQGNVRPPDTAVHGYWPPTMDTAVIFLTHEGKRYVGETFLVKSSYMGEGEKTLPAFFAIVGTGAECRRQVFFYDDVSHWQLTVDEREKYPYGCELGRLDFLRMPADYPRETDLKADWITPDIYGGGVLSNPKGELYDNFMYPPYGIAVEFTTHEIGNILGETVQLVQGPMHSYHTTAFFSRDGKGHPRIHFAEEVLQWQGISRYQETIL